MAPAGSWGPRHQMQLSFTKIRLCAWTSRAEHMEVTEGDDFWRSPRMVPFAPFSHGETTMMELGDAGQTNTMRENCPKTLRGHVTVQVVFVFPRHAFCALPCEQRASVEFGKHVHWCQFLLCCGGYSLESNSDGGLLRNPFRTEKPWLTGHVLPSIHGCPDCTHNQ